MLGGTHAARCKSASDSAVMSQLAFNQSRSLSECGLFTRIVAAIQTLTIFTIQCLFGVMINAKGLHVQVDFAFSFKVPEIICSHIKPLSLINEFYSTLQVKN